MSASKNTTRRDFLSNTLARYCGPDSQRRAWPSDCAAFFGAAGTEPPFSNLENDMFIKTILSEHRNDFTATLECEHCGSTQHLGSGYHDNFYHVSVIPAIGCHSCGKRRDGSGGQSEMQSVAA